MKTWSVDRKINVRNVIDGITMEGYYFEFIIREPMVFLYMTADGRCNITKKPYKWKSREWLLHPNMTDGEVVQTAFLCAMTAMEHELREQFKYKGAMVMNPHHDIDNLVKMAEEPGYIKERERA